MKTFFAFLILISITSHANDIVEFKKVTANIGKNALVVEIARTDTERQLGLMHRTQIGENNGMLFIFEDEQPRSFWMKNTLIPLSIAYLNSKKEIVDIQEMVPGPKSASQTIPTYPSLRPAMYALEMNRGWFKKHGIKACDGSKSQACQRLDVNLVSK